MLSKWMRKSSSDEADKKADKATGDAAGVAALFPGITNSDLTTLFNISEQRTLPSGAELLAAGSKQTSLYFVLQGRIELCLPQGGSVCHVCEGEWLIAGQSASPVVARMHNEGKLLLINPQDMNRFSEAFQLVLHQQFATAYQALLVWMAEQQSGLLVQRQGLAELLYAARTRQDEDLSRSELVQQVIRKVPRLPVSTLELLNKMLDEKTTRPEIVELVRHDPALTSMLLKAINSPAYNFHQKVSDLNHAIGLLGFDSVYQIVMLESMRKSMPESPLFQAIYQRSLEVSYIAFTLSQVCAIGKPAEASTLGLLHDLGSIVRELMREQNPKLASLLSLLEPAMLGAELLKSWHLPEQVCSSIQYQDHPEFARPDQVPEVVRANVALIYLAHCVCDRLHKVPQILTPYIHDYLAVLGQSDISLEQLMEDKLLPALKKRRSALPVTLVEVLE